MAEHLVAWKCGHPTCLCLTIRQALPRGEKNEPPGVCDRCLKITEFASVPLVNEPPEEP